MLMHVQRLILIDELRETTSLIMEIIINQSLVSVVGGGVSYWLVSWTLDPVCWPLCCVLKMIQVQSNLDYPDSLGLG